MTTLRQRIAIDSRYVFAGFPTAVIAFALTIAGISAGLGSLVAVVGLPVLAATAFAARRFADLERSQLPDVLGRPVERPDYPEAPAGSGWFRRVVQPLTIAQTWADLIHAIVAFPFAVASFVIAVVWWTGAIAGLTFPLYGWAIAGIPGFDGGLPAFLGLGDGSAVFILFNTAVGALFALTLMPALRTAALLKAGISQSLLTRPVYGPTRSAVESIYA